MQLTGQGASWLGPAKAQGVATNSLLDELRWEGHDRLIARNALNVRERRAELRELVKDIRQDLLAWVDGEGRACLAVIWKALVSVCSY
jgi:hypothetical protein